MCETVGFDVTLFTRLVVLLYSLTELHY
ncbi:hypothetical protein SBA1_440008 [Candidatus Sulfotelmatobacter kueseliae]|uniref:Uncharacterized protein n=1 Tax=Candidatus Sulfotelmatobacter kueseliae TaxID=2042962 RepID=A0A2U3KRS0_9BACT|nr:hypothetical protein SBA1_440008 [Candidatus Sulfotelmatobacter kueseliae]